MLKLSQALFGFLVLIAGSAHGQPRTAVAEVAAALTLAQEGVNAKDASLIVTGLEIFTDHAPAGPVADAVFATFTAEAQFLLRGDAHLDARLRSVRSQMTTATQSAHIRVFEITQALTLPAGTEIRTVAVTNGAILNSLADSSGQRCTRRAKTWHCGFAPAHGVLMTDGHITAGPAWLVTDIVAVAP